MSMDTTSSSTTLSVVCDRIFTGIKEQPEPEYIYNYQLGRQYRMVYYVGRHTSTHFETALLESNLTSEQWELCGNSLSVDNVQLIDDEFYNTHCAKAIIIGNTTLTPDTPINAFRFRITHSKHNKNKKQFLSYNLRFRVVSATGIFFWSSFSQSSDKIIAISKVCQESLISFEQTPENMIDGWFQACLLSEARASSISARKLIWGASEDDDLDTFKERLLTTKDTDLFQFKHPHLEKHLAIDITTQTIKPVSRQEVIIDEDFKLRKQHVKKPVQKIKSKKTTHRRLNLNKESKNEKQKSSQVGTKRHRDQDDDADYIPVEDLSDKRFTEHSYWNYDQEHFEPEVHQFIPIPSMFRPQPIIFTQPIILQYLPQPLFRTNSDEHAANVLYGFYMQNHR